ncbi:hypothetical protein AZ006_003955 [Citrobacter freundii]|nr:hypothetical protein AZ006_003955 [Citrobacter freundii]
MHANSTFFSSKKTLLAIVGTTVLLTSGFSKEGANKSLI